MNHKKTLSYRINNAIATAVTIAAGLAVIAPFVIVTLNVFGR